MRYTVRVGRPATVRMRGFGRVASATTLNPRIVEATVNENGVGQLLGISIGDAEVHWLMQSGATFIDQVDVVSEVQLEAASNLQVVAADLTSVEVSWGLPEVSKGLTGFPVRIRKGLRADTDVTADDWFRRLIFAPYVRSHTFIALDSGTDYVVQVGSLAGGDTPLAIAEIQVRTADDPRRALPTPGIPFVNFLNDFDYIIEQPTDTEIATIGWEYQVAPSGTENWGDTQFVLNEEGGPGSPRTVTGRLALSDPNDAMSLPAQIRVRQRWIPLNPITFRPSEWSAYYDTGTFPVPLNAVLRRTPNGLLVVRPFLDARAGVWQYAYRSYAEGAQPSELNLPTFAPLVQGAPFSGEDRTSGTPPYPRRVENGWHLGSPRQAATDEFGVEIPVTNKKLVFDVIVRQAQSAVKIPPGSPNPTGLVPPTIEIGPWGGPATASLKLPTPTWRIPRTASNRVAIGMGNRMAFPDDFPPGYPYLQGWQVQILKDWQRSSLWEVVHEVLFTGADGAPGAPTKPSAGPPIVYGALNKVIEFTRGGVGANYPAEWLVGGRIAPGRSLLRVRWLGFDTGTTRSPNDIGDASLTSEWSDILWRTGQFNGGIAPPPPEMESVGQTFDAQGDVITAIRLPRPDIALSVTAVPGVQSLTDVPWTEWQLRWREANTFLDADGGVPAPWGDGEWRQVTLPITTENYLVRYFRFQNESPAGQRGIEMQYRVRNPGCAWSASGYLPMPIRNPYG